MSFFTELFDNSPCGAKGSFLSKLTGKERVQVSNCNPILYETIIEEKKSGEVVNIITQDRRLPELLRKLSIPELETLRASVTSAMEGDKYPATMPSSAAKAYKKAFELNPYNDLALMSYGCTIANMGNIREGMRWVEKALAVNPENERARMNIEGMKWSLHAALDK